MPAAHDQPSALDSLKEVVIDSELWLTLPEHSDSLEVGQIPIRVSQEPPIGRPNEGEFSKTNDQVATSQQPTETSWLRLSVVEQELQTDYHDKAVQTPPVIQNDMVDRTKTCHWRNGFLKVLVSALKLDRILHCSTSKKKRSLA